ncbi:hypothetical protein ACH3XW_10620 [Acanthocheilonema viteae]
MEIFRTVLSLIFFTFVHSNQLDQKSLQRRCDSLIATTCTCADPLVQWNNDKGQILKINEIYHDREKLFCYIFEFINHTNYYELTSDAQNCKHLEERYDVSMEPALFLTFQRLSFDTINGFFWFNNTNDIHESILLSINQSNTNDSCLKFFLSYNNENEPILRSIKCETKISQYIRVCYYAVDYIVPTTKMIDEKHLQFKKGNLFETDERSITSIAPVDITAGIKSASINTKTNWSNKCSYLLWTYKGKKICYVPVVKYFKRTESLHYNLMNKMCSKKFPWISARIRSRKQISIFRNLVESFLKANEIHMKYVPVLTGLIHMRGMGFIWTSGNNGSYLNSWNSIYDRLYDEMPFWTDPTFHPYLNTTEIHCHRFVIWTHTKDNYARAIPCEYPTNINLVLCEYDMEI